MSDLVIARLLALSRGMLEAIERALAGKRKRLRHRAIQLAEQHAENWIEPQFVMIEQILVAERQSIYPLRH